MLFKISVNGGKLHYGKNLNTSLCGIKKNDYHLVRGVVDCKNCVRLKKRSIKKLIESIPTGRISGPKIKLSIKVAVRQELTHGAMVKNGNMVELPYTEGNLLFVKGITNNFRLVC